MNLALIHKECWDGDEALKLALKAVYEMDPYAFPLFASGAKYHEVYNGLEDAGAICRGGGEANNREYCLFEMPARPPAGEDGAELNQFESKLFAAGWVKSPNNIYGLQGSTWYRSGPGVKILPYPQEPQVLHDRIRVFTTKFFGTHYTRRSFTDTVTVAVFDDVEAFLAWVEVVGVPKPPPGPNVFD